MPSDNDKVKRGRDEEENPITMETEEDHLERSASEDSLVMDPRAYRVYHRLAVKLPSLSFEIVPHHMKQGFEVGNLTANTEQRNKQQKNQTSEDEKEGDPISMFIVSGTQAPHNNLTSDSTTAPTQNELTLMRLENLRMLHSKKKKRKNKKKQGGDDLQEEDESSSSSSSDSENDDATAKSGGAMTPRVSSISAPHNGSVNRVRLLKHNTANSQQTPSDVIVASWSDLGLVYLWNLRDSMKSLLLNASSSTSISSSSSPGIASPIPMHTICAHPTEGFALDWSPQYSQSQQNQSIRLLSGDCAGHLALTCARESDWFTECSATSATTNRNVASGGGGGSVEDIQWSPNESSVFACCRAALPTSSSSQLEASPTLQIYDIRAPHWLRVGGAQCNVIEAHGSATDVNVIGWSALTPHLLASGGDDGVIRVWDLRNLAATCASRNKSGSQTTANQIGACTHVFRLHENHPITSVEWHPTDAFLLAAASEDNQISQWDISLEGTAEEQEVEVTTTANEEAAQPPAQLLFTHSGQKEIKELHWLDSNPGVLVSTAMDGFNVFRSISV